ncbi:MAG: VOC family protein [Actinobacteria bacterium]|nr:VOC family protein [Actinomycetota bacterium]
MTLTLAHVTLDCQDATKLAGFWSEALGRPVDDGAEPFFSSIGFPAKPGEQAWLFIQVPEVKTAKNRMHVDLTTDDRHAEVARLVALGATQVGEHDEYGHRWTVLQDPEGNEFCVA